MPAPRHIEHLITIGQIAAVIAVGLLIAVGANALVSVQLVRSTPATPVMGQDDNTPPEAAVPQGNQTGIQAAANTLAFNRNLFNKAAAEQDEQDNGDTSVSGLTDTNDADKNAENSDAEAMPTSDLPLTLLAAMVADDPHWSVAYMRHTTSNEDIYARPGDSIIDATLVQVARTWVSVRRADGALEVITLGGETSVQMARQVDTKTRRRTASSSTSPKPLGNTPFIHVESSSVTTSDDGAVVFDRQTIVAQAEFDRKLADALGLDAMNENGRVTGYRVGRVASNTMFQHMGLREGDVIIGVNGRRPHDKTTATKFVRDLSRKGEVVVEIDRRGERSKITLRAE